MKRIGLLGGSSDQATAEYYRRLNSAVNQRLGGWNTAEVIIHSLNFALAERWVRTDDWAAAATDLAARAAALERAGADIILCVSNTLHRVADEFSAATRIPVLHIVDPTAAAIRRAGLSCVGLLGTRPVMATDALKRRYRDRFGLQVVVPSEKDQIEVDRIIFDELCRGIFAPQAKKLYLRIIDDLVSAGAQGIVLGCTEIPLLVGQGDRPLVPFFDTVALHVEAAVEWALSRDDATSTDM